MTIEDKSMGRRGITPSQTVGPFFHYCLTPKAYGYAEIVTNDLLTEDAAGERIRIEGRVFDGDGQPVTDALIEIWQADGEGRYASPADRRARPNTRFKGFGRSDCNAEGRYRFTTVKPGPVPGPNGAVQAPHINVGVFARGVLTRLFTRIYFEGEAANADDPILALAPEDARATLIARRTGQSGEPTYTFDIHLQGKNETVFFDA
jgi:protocatechuate 3,4-dioxygenase, alpha subunit